MSKHKQFPIAWQRIIITHWRQVASILHNGISTDDGDECHADLLATCLALHEQYGRAEMQQRRALAVVGVNVAPRGMQEGGAHVD